MESSPAGFLCCSIQVFCKVSFCHFSVYIAEADKQSDTALTGLETSDVSFARASSRSVLLIADNVERFFKKIHIFQKKRSKIKLSMIIAWKKGAG